MSAPDNITIAALTGRANSLEFILKQFLGSVRTITLGQVVEIKATGVSPVGMLTVKPLIMQMDNSEKTFEHAPIYNVPYLRLQGGVSAVILDPQPGDIGLLALCDRDNSRVKATKKEAAPGSGRRFSLSDAIYLGGVLNGEPKQYIHFTENGITIKAAALTVEGDIKCTGDVVADSVSLSQHRHSGVKAGGDISGGPV